ncbi:MAG: LysM peptidoglycan-binding domain-containing protein [Litoreibacter sp.]|nr:LysM peptidoglycan-binding domain-containing protein [Litoreibacter sp.]
MALPPLGEGVTTGDKDHNMADQPGLKVNGSNALLIAGIAALAIAIFVVFIRGQSPVDEVAAPADDDATVAILEPKDIEEEPEVEATAQAPTEEEIAPEEIVEPLPEPAPEPIAPSFDVVRIDPTGAAVIAGSAEPGARVRLMAGDEVVGEATADASGKFVALFDLSPSTEPRSLSAEFDGLNGEVIASAGTVLIAPTARPEPVEVAEATPETGVEEALPKEDVIAETAQEAAEEIVVAETTETPVNEEQVAENAPLVTDETSTEEAPVAEAQPATPEVAAAETEQEPVIAEAPAAQEVEGAIEQAEVPAPADENGAETPAVVAESTQEKIEEPVDSPAIVLADESGVKVLQPAPQPVVPKLAPDETEEQVANLVIDTITYDAEGDVAVSGRGAGESFARVYVDDTAIKTVPIKPDGTWDAPLPEITAGIYNLRIDEVDPEGAVTSRVETPFKRETPEVVAEAAARPNAVTVQEGFTLWAIAKDRFGDGTQYVRVYEANRDLIRDPDLIYPGQIFEIPEG